MAAEASASPAGPAALERAAKVLARSPFYRDLWGTDRAPATLEELAALPLVQRDDIVRAQREAPPYGAFGTVDPDAIEHVFVAPAGPLVMAYTGAEFDRLAGLFGAVFRGFGVGSRDIADNTFGFQWVLGGFVVSQGLQSLGCAVLPGGPGSSEQHLENMRLVDATVLVSVPTFVHKLAERSGEDGASPLSSLRLICVSGEIGSPAMRRRITERFGATVREWYGTGDTGPVAVDCVDGLGMHLLDDHYVEIVDGDGAHVAAGEAGDIVVTELWRETLPLLRFRTGDVADYRGRVDCSCGRELPTIGPILGRSDSLIRVKGSFLDPGRLEQICDELDVHRYRLVVERGSGGDDIRLAIPGDDLAAAGGLAERVAERVKARLGMTVHVEATDEALDAGQRVVDDRRPAWS